MKLKDLINKYTWKQVSQRLEQLYDDVEKSIKGYNVAFIQLQDISNDFDFKVSAKLEITMQKPFVGNDEPYADFEEFRKNCRPGD